MDRFPYAVPPCLSGQAPRWRPRRLAGIVGLCWLTSACSPALNWREVNPAQADGLQALFPCKPDAHERHIPWPGLPDGVTMRMLSCQTDGATWALSYVSLPDVTLVAPALNELTVMMRRNLGAAAQMAGSASSVAEQDLGPIAVPRMTPLAQAHGWRFQAQRPDGWGRPMDMDIRSWHFSHGLTVFQASVWRPDEQTRGQSSEDVADAFFRGLHFPN